MDIEFLDEAINELINGSAICLIGAGFSLGATDAEGKYIPSVAELNKEICQLAKLENEESASLSELADYCEDDAELFSKLKILLIKRLTFCKPTPDQQTILEMPWRAVFTTNFDDIAEICLHPHGVIPVTPTFHTKNLTSNKTPLYYLHGRALDIIEGQTNPKFVLSERNYLELRQRNVDLYSTLENEIQCATRIFFIGYSMRDAEIASRLFAIEGIKQKSIFITHPNNSQVTINRLKKFGTTYPISASGFAERLRNIPRTSNGKIARKTTSFVSKAPIAKVKSEISMDDFDHLILTGEFEPSAFASQQTHPEKGPEYCVERTDGIEQIFDSAANTTNRFVISSDLGNGKTVFLGQLTSVAQSKGYDVYTINKQLPEMYTELDELLAGTKRQMFIIDDHARYRTVANFIGKRLPGQSILIASVRNSIDSPAYVKLSENLGGQFREIDLNILSHKELVAWDRILERWGLWEDRIELTEAERYSFLKNNCASENRAIVVSLFNTSRLSEKIDTMVNYFLNKNEGLTKPFIAVIINALCQKHVEWPRIVNWLNIDELKFKNAVMDSPVSTFMTDRKNWFQFTSAELASFILGRFDFDFADIVDVYTEIVRQTAYSANDLRSGFDAVQNLKELMKFRFLTRLFSERAEANTTILAVYHRLSNVPRIRRNDQFYLQYAMANMAVGDLDKAGSYIETAIGLANKKGIGYSKRQILDQRVRLRFLKNTSSHKSFIKSEIVESISDLTKALSEKGEYHVHPLRSASLIYDFLERWCDDLDVDLVEKINGLVELMKLTMPPGNLAKSQKGETQHIRKSISDCSILLQNL